MAGQGLAWHGESRQFTADSARNGMAWIGAARLGDSSQARTGAAGRGVARCGKAWNSLQAGFGEARHGKARHGLARRGDSPQIRPEISGLFYFPQMPHIGHNSLKK
jgi:hypothetical protein